MDEQQKQTFENKRKAEIEAKKAKEVATKKAREDVRATNTRTRVTRKTDEKCV